MFSCFVCRSQLSYRKKGLTVLRRSLEGLQWLEFELFAEFQNLSHYLLLRHGGYSQGPYSSLNLNPYAGDNPIHVSANLEKVKKVLQISLLIQGEQIHGKEVVLIENNHSHFCCDGFLTDKPGIALMTRHADCQIAFIYDPLNHVIANIHCGWRGNVQNIYAEAIAKMKGLFFSKPENLFVGISPSLGPENGEFVNYKKEFPDHFTEFQVKPNYFDLWRISETQLLALGIKRNHLQIARMDTHQGTDDFFSHRREKPHGGHGAIICLRS